jgi:hypothetical protein
MTSLGCTSLLFIQWTFKTLSSFGRDFVVAKPEKGEDIFTYFTRIEKMSKGLTIREPEEVGIADVKVISELALKLKMLHSTSFYGQYKSFANKFRTRKPSKWLKITQAEIIDELKTIHDNSASMEMSRGPSANYMKSDVGRQSGDGRGRSRSRGAPADRSRSKSTGPVLGCPKEACWSYWEKGTCPYESAQKKCAFSHLRPQGAQAKGPALPPQIPPFPKNDVERKAYGLKPQQQQQPQQPQQQQQQQQQRCTKCDGNHHFEKCTFKGECGYCKKPGHTQKACRKKKADDKPKLRVHLAIDEPVRVAAVDDDDA